MSKIPRALVLGALFLLGSHTAFAAQVTLTWDAVNDGTLAGYKIYYGTASKNYTTSLDVKNITTRLLTGLSDATTYYFAATAYNSDGESGFSNEVTYTTGVTCTFSLSSGSASFGPPGGTGSVSVIAPSGCGWSSSSVPSWLTVTSGKTGTGNGTFNYTVAANTATSSRTAALTIAGLVFTVTQEGLKTYTITASAGTGGSISPAGSVTVTQGSSKSFTIASGSGYYVSGVQVDGKSVGAVSSYTFSNVTANHTISATFNVAVYTITASATAGGKITPAGTVNVTRGSNQTFTIARYPGYTLADVKVDGVSVGKVTSYTFSNVTANHTIAASFAQ